MTFTGMGMNVPSPRLDPNCQCICHRQPGVAHVAACCQAKAPASDPAVLASLPEVQALIAAAYEVAAVASMSYGPSYYMTQGGSGFQETHTKLGAFAFRTDIRDAIRNLTPDDATASLARIERKGEARGLERAAARARVYASNYEQSSDGRNTFILLAEWADAEAAAILAHADQIEKDAK